MVGASKTPGMETQTCSKHERRRDKKEESGQRSPDSRHTSRADSGIVCPSTLTSTAALLIMGWSISTKGPWRMMTSGGGWASRASISSASRPPKDMSVLEVKGPAAAHTRMGPPEDLTFWIAAALPCGILALGADASV
jgi:hypothetical protein